MGLAKSVIATALSGSAVSRANILEMVLSHSRCGVGEAAGNCFTSARGLDAFSSSGMPLMRPSMTWKEVLREPSAFWKIPSSAPSIQNSGQA